MNYLIIRIPEENLSNYFASFLRKCHQNICANTNDKSLFLNAFFLKFT